MILMFYFSIEHVTFVCFVDHPQICFCQQWHIIFHAIARMYGRIPHMLITTLVRNIFYIGKRIRQASTNLINIWLYKNHNQVYLGNC